MSDISPIGRPSSAAFERPSSIARTPRIAPTSREGDQAEISTAAKMLSRLDQLPDIRHDLVARVRAEIEAGTYDTPDKVDALLDELVADLY